MNPAFISIGLFLFLIAFAFWLSLDIKPPFLRWGDNSLPPFDNPPPPPKQKKEVCVACWSDGVVKDSPFEVNFVATICDDCEKKALAFHDWIMSENERLTAEIEEKKNELDLLEKSKVVYKPIDPIVIDAFEPIETIEPIVFDKFQKPGRSVRKVTAIKPEDDK